MASEDTESNDSSPHHTDVTREDESITTRHILDLTFCFFAWACTICNVTLVIGSSALVAKSIGSSDKLLAIPLGAFFFGASIVSLVVTPWMFSMKGRKFTFLLGIFFGIIGSSLGAVSVAFRYPLVNSMSTFFFGMAMGIGFHIRFAAIELVPEKFMSKAVALVVSGGCLAAFIGPESGNASRNLFDTEYMGIFLVTGIINIANAAFTALVDFPRPQMRDTNNSLFDTNVFFLLLRQSNFIVPVILETSCWSIMAAPMGLARTAMTELGYSMRQSLLVIELHFLAMYTPGFFTGALLQRFGPIISSFISMAIFLISLVPLFLCETIENGGSIASWISGLILIGIAWNIGFTSGTVWIGKVYKDFPTLRVSVQAANDFFMFFISGVYVVSTSFIYEAGGSGISGWRLLNYTVAGIVVVTSLILISHTLWRRNSG